MLAAYYRRSEAPVAGVRASRDAAPVLHAGDQEAFPGDASNGNDPASSAVRSKPLGMTVVEQQLNKSIIEERDQRVKAVKDLWVKLDQVQEEVHRRPLPLRHAAPSDAAAASGGAGERAFAEDIKDLRAKLEQVQEEVHSRPPPSHPVAASGAAAGAVERASAEVATLRSELAVLQGALEAQQRSMDSGLKDMKRSLTETMERAREAAEKANSDELKELRTRLDKLGTEKAVSDNSGWGFSRSRSATVAASTDAAEELRNELKALEDTAGKHAADLGSMRSVLISLQVSMPLLAVKSSRIALRSPELSPAERQSSLSTLDERERLIREDSKQVQDRARMYPTCPLSQVIEGTSLIEAEEELV